MILPTISFLITEDLRVMNQTNKTVYFTCIRMRFIMLVGIGSHVQVTGIKFKNWRYFLTVRLGHNYSNYRKIRTIPLISSGNILKTPAGGRLKTVTSCDQRRTLTSCASVGLGETPQRALPTRRLTSRSSGAKYISRGLEALIVDCSDFILSIMLCPSLLLCLCSKK